MFFFSRTTYLSLPWTSPVNLDRFSFTFHWNKAMNSNHVATWKCRGSSPGPPMPQTTISYLHVSDLDFPWSTYCELSVYAYPYDIPSEPPSNTERLRWNMDDPFTPLSYISPALPLRIMLGCHDWMTMEPGRVFDVWAPILLGFCT
jgi:hypothetical protein